MTKTIVPAILLVLLCVTFAAAQDLNPPKLTPSPSTDNQKRLINEGIALHDRGDFDGAIAKYQEVLKENPDNDWALYELAYTYQTKKDHKKSLEIAYKGAQYKSDKLGEFYGLIGNGLDDLGEGKKAIEVYNKGIKIQPDNHLLYFNLALAQARLSNLEEAKKNLKKAAYLNPNHATSHMVLAQVFNSTQYRTPALFAVMRFLVVEPKSRRSVSGYKLFRDILSGGATPGKNPNEINIFMNLGGKKDEGDFGAVEMTLGLSGAVGMSEEKKNKSEGERLVDQLNTFLAIVSELDPKGDKSKFSWRYYIPYFIELKQKNFVEPFAYYVSQSSDLKGASEWLAANQTRVNEFVNWSRSYQWAKEDK